VLDGPGKFYGKALAEHGSASASVAVVERGELVSGPGGKATRSGDDGTNIGSPIAL
jgi:hypothetical protein